MSLLSIQHLSIRFGDSVAVNDVSLTIEKGSITAFVGESGSGKTLTALSILQLLPPEAAVSGSILFTGKNIHASSSELGERAISPRNGGGLQERAGRASHQLAKLAQRSPAGDLAEQLKNLRGNRVGMIFQEPMSALNPLHTIDRQITEAFCWHKKISRHSVEAKQKLAELLDLVGLTYLKKRERVYPHQLSGGERQRVMIAMAISLDPDLLIADEPTTALDVALQQQILTLLKDLQRARGMGMIFITHDLLTVRQIADQVIVMHEGEIVEHGHVDAIFTHPRHAYTKMLLAAAPSGGPVPLQMIGERELGEPAMSPRSGAQRSPAGDLAEQPKEILNATISVHFPIKTGLLRRVTRTVTAVDNVSLTIHEGETVGIVGESGSGKSSLGFGLLRLIESSGPIIFMGARLDQMQKRELRAARRHLQLVFQDPYGSLNPRMTVEELITEGLHVHTNAIGLGERSSAQHVRSAEQIQNQLDEILRHVGLTPDMKHRYPHAFSGGQRQRIAIARAMILKPALVVLDEPTSALDMSVQSQVLDLLKTLQQTHRVAYLFISHDLRVIRAMAHQVLVLNKGQVVERGPAQTLFSNPQHAYTRSLLKAALS